MLKKLTISKEHVLNALTGYAAALSMINDDEAVVDIKQGNNTFYLTVSEEDYSERKSKEVLVD